LLTFFRINSIFQVITLLVILFLLRFPYVGNALPLLTTELEWMLVGEKLNEGLSLYSGVLTQVGPLSAFFYRMMDLWFGKNQFMYETVAAILVLIQTLYFVFIVNRRNLLTEKNYIPGLFYLILMSCSFDFLKLSPILLSQIFMLIALNVALRQIEKRDGVGDDVFETGLFIGIATLFYLPSFVFIFWAILVLFLYTGINIRQMFMVILAFLLPIFFTYLFFYFNNLADDFLQIWLFNFANAFSLTLLGIRDIIITYSLPVALSILGIIRIFRMPRYNNFQNRAHQLLIIFGIFSFISLFLSQNFAPANLMFLVPFLAFFIAGFFVHYKKTFAPEVLSLTFFVVILFITYFGAKPSFGPKLLVLEKNRIEEEPFSDKYANKRIFVTGEHIYAYKNAKMATGYLSWKLAKNDFKNPNNYLSLVNIYANFKKDMPEVIFDKERVMPKILKNIPELADKYTSPEKNVYVLKK
jgi:hypothetical protein